MSGVRRRARAAVWAAAAVVAAAAPTGATPPVKRASSVIAVTADGATLLIANPDSATVSLVVTATGAVAAELEVGVDPRTVAVEGRRAFVANHGDDTVSVVDLGAVRVVATVRVGPRPYGVVADPAGDRVFVAEQGAGTVAVIAGPPWRVVERITVGDRPSGLAITADGSSLLVTHLLAGDLTLVDLASFGRRTVALWPDSNLVQSVVLAPGDGVALVPHTRSNSANPHLTFDTTVFPLVSRVDPVAGRHLVGQHLSLDTLDPPSVGLPFDAAVSGDGAVLWVVNAASNDLTVVDLSAGRRLAHIEVGANPRGVVLSPDGRRAYVANVLDGTVSVVDAGSYAVEAVWQVTELPLPPALLAGKRLFWSSDDPRLAQSQWIACASCHFDGEHDGRTWRFGFAGPRNTTSLNGMVQTYPLRWSAEWDESADSEIAITSEQFGSGLLGGAAHHPLGAPNGERSSELDALGAYLDGLQMPTNRLANGLDPEAVARGVMVFADPVTGCAGCHPPPYFTDFAVHDVGTADGPDERLGPAIDTPTLRDLARSAPYLHHGAAATVRDVLTSTNPSDLHGVTSHLSAGELSDLETFLLSLPDNNHARRDLPPEAARARVGLPSPAPRRPGRRIGGLGVIRGQVRAAGSGEPLVGALATVRGTALQTRTDVDGHFELRLPEATGEVEVAGWATGFYVASLHAHPGDEVALELRRLHAGDDPDYRWIDPTPDAAEPLACGHCHPAIVPQWRGNAHGGAITNPRFLSLYNGSDASGTWDPVGVGFRLDYPGLNGVCAACHAPAAAIDDPFGTDMNEVFGRLEAGIHCDFCHKTLRARVIPKTAAVYPAMPGVFALDVRRPPAGDQVFFGPYPDVHDPDSYAPSMRSSSFCAPCHQFSFWGTPIYTSYDEWRASPYADPEHGQTCQGCHMPPTGDRFFALPERGGIERPPETIASHLQLGVRDEAFMASAVRLELDVAAAAGEVMVAVTVTNTGAGHHLPTDHPGRHLLLEIAAVDDAGERLTLLEGPLIPAWGGGLAGLPGTGYAKLLEDVASGEWPVVSYWKQALIRADTRLPALAADTTVYRLARPPDGAVTVSATLRFRRLFADLARRAGWETGELVLATRTVEVPPP